MTKFSWEPLDGGSLLLRIAEGDRETTWKITKRTPIARLRNMLWEMESLLDEYNPRFERIPGVNAHPTEAEIREVYGSSVVVEANTEEASRAAQAAYAEQLSITAKWWEDEDEESPFVAALPDYDAGEI